MEMQSVPVVNKPRLYDERLQMLAEAYVALCRLTDEEVQFILKMPVQRR